MIVKLYSVQCDFIKTSAVDKIKLHNLGIDRIHYDIV